MNILVGKEICRDLDRSVRCEWLETNGIGGFSCGTLPGLNTRRYHGLFIPALHPPVGRMVVLSKLEEVLRIPGTGSFELGSNSYYGAIHPNGYRYLEHVRLDPFPIFTYRVDGMLFEKQVFMVHGQNAVVAIYGPTDRDATLTMRPLVAFRDYHQLTRQNADLNPHVDISDGHIAFHPYEGQPTLHIAHNGRFVPQGDWYYNFEYAVEAYRGLDSQEDLYSPGEFTFKLKAGESARLLIGLEPRDVSEIDALQKREVDHRKCLVQAAPADDPDTRQLTLAADAFIAKRFDGLSTILAGYPWFTDWGRDTMIALPGLTLVTKRFDEARDILSAFASVCDQGMIPNRFPDHGQTPDYNSVDATLWYVHAVDRYLTYTGDLEFVHDTLWPVLTEIVHWFCNGTRYGIRLDGDGLLRAGEPGQQLTWMDAKVDDWVVTPREGKPVEINALWYNALCVLYDLAEKFEDIDRATEYAHLASRAKKRFATAFWNPDTNCLFDCLTDGGPDPAIRPNQIFALSLPHRMLSEDQERQILDVVERDLLTPYGLRSLAPSDPAYQGAYGGDQRSRDGAYHQGTVWAWLIGPFVTAWMRLNQAKPHAQRSGAGFLEALRRHLYDSGLGQIAEIFDGDPPHAPHGCFAQAWSVAEVLRAYVEDVLGQKPEA